IPLSLCRDRSLPQIAGLASGDTPDIVCTSWGGCSRPGVAAGRRGEDGVTHAGQGSRRRIQDELRPRAFRPEAFSGAGAQRRFPSALLLPALALALAGGDQGRRARPGHHRRGVRPGGALAKGGDPNTLGRRAEGLRETPEARGLHALQSFSEGRVLLPVLRLERRSDLRSRGPEVARRGDELGQCRGRLFALQPEEGEPVAETVGPVAAALAAPALGRGDAARRPAVPAELPAPKLGRLRLLGCRTGGIALAAPGAGEDPAVAHLDVEPRRGVTSGARGVRVEDAHRPADADS